jgi:hypothetical protein
VETSVRTADASVMSDGPKSSGRRHQLAASIVSAPLPRCRPAGERWQPSQVPERW